MNTIHNKCKGCFYGLAVGDAFGAPVEFKRRYSFPPVMEMLPCGTWGLPAGSFTDDTSMMLCLAASIVNSDGVQDPHNVLEHYVEWFTQGYMSVNGKCFDIGYATRTALMNYMSNGGSLVAEDDEEMSGNGSLMRLSPIPIMWGKRVEEAWKQGELSSLTTHGSKQCVWSTGFYAALVGMAIQGATKKEMKEWILKQDPAKAPPQLKHIISGEFLTKKEDKIRSGGYVVDTLEAALWAFYATDTFEDGLRLIVNLGHDTDTTGAVFGILGGAYYGFEGIPERWVEALQRQDMLHGVFTDLWELAKKNWA